MLVASVCRFAEFDPRYASIGPGGPCDFAVGGHIKRVERLVGNVLPGLTAIRRDRDPGSTDSEENGFRQASARTLCAASSAMHCVATFCHGRW